MKRQGGPSPLLRWKRSSDQDGRFEPEVEEGVRRARKVGRRTLGRVWGQWTREGVPVRDVSETKTVRSEGRRVTVDYGRYDDYVEFSECSR